MTPEKNGCLDLLPVLREEACLALLRAEQKRRRPLATQHMRGSQQHASGNLWIASDGDFRVSQHGQGAPQ